MIKERERGKEEGKRRGRVLIEVYSAEEERIGKDWKGKEGSLRGCCNHTRTSPKEKKRKEKKRRREPRQ